jgi:hypothetical protein
MEMVAELHRQALTSVRNLCDNTGHHLEPSLRSGRIRAVVEDVQKLLDRARNDVVDKETRRRAYEAAADVLWKLSSCFEQNGWDLRELGDLAKLRNSLGR